MQHDGHADQPLTVARLRQERLLRDSTVLAGDETTSSPIRWCQSVRDLDEHSGELAGVVVMGDEHELTPLVVEQVAGAGAAALFVRNWSPERWADPTSGAGLPVIGVPPTATVLAVAQLVARLSLAFESHILVYADTVHSALAQQLHRGAGVDALCQRIARLSDCTTAILGTDFRLIAFDQGLQGWLDPTTTGNLLRDLREEIETGTRRDRHQPHRTATIPGAVGGRRLTVVAAAIDLAEQREGWVVLVDAMDPPHEHDLAQARVVAQQASTIVGTELLRVRSVERAEERARGNFVHALLHGRFSNQADLVARAAHHDFDVNARYGVVVAQGSGLIAEGDSPTRLANMAREAVRPQPTHKRRSLAAVVGDVLGVVHQVSPAQRAGRDPGVDELREYAEVLERRLQRYSDHPVLLTFGRPVVGALNIVDSYREARIALGLRTQLGLASVYGFSDLRVHSALLELAQAPTGRDFAQEILAPLRGARGGSLEDVVRAYVESGGNLNEASRRLNVHRNTMLYKLDRVGRLLGMDLRAPETQFTVWLALRLSALSGTADAVSKDLSAG
jgi:sugar diacid utilization regulator